MKKSSSLLPVLLVAASFPAVFAGVITGSHSVPAEGRPNDPVVFLGRFCFTSTASKEETGHVFIEAKNFGPDPVHVLAIVDTEWDKLYADGMGGVTCDAIRKTRAGSLSSGGGWAKIPVGKSSTELSFWETQRSHYWFFVASACAPEGKPSSEDASVWHLDWRLEFNNVGGWWRRQFSNDEMGMLWLSGSFLGAFAVLVAVHLRGLLIWARTDGRVHALVRLLTAAIVLGMLRHLLEFVHYCLYVDDGVGLPSVRFGGALVHVLSQLCLLVLLIVVSRGWTISSQELTGRAGIVAMTLLLLNAYWMLLIYWAFFHDPARTDFIYDSPPGLVIIAIRIGTWVWFLHSLSRTVSDEYDEAKTAFYRRFGAVFSVWFVYLPVVALVASFLDPWVRERTCFIVEGVANIYAFAAMAYLLWPTRSESLFKITARDVNNSLETVWDSL